MVFQYKQVTLTGHEAGLNIREKPEKILVPLIEENGETWKMATSGSRYMFFEKLAIPMLSGSELLQKPDASDEIHDAVRKFSMLFVTSVIERLFWQHHRQPNVVWSVSFCTDLLWQDIFGYEPEGPGTELLLKGENMGLIGFPYSRGFIAVYASADSRWPILPQERIALWAENRWGDRMQVDKSWVITGKSHKPAAMYTMLKSIDRFSSFGNSVCWRGLYQKPVCCLSGCHLSGSVLFQEIESDSEKLLTVVTGVANSLFWISWLYAWFCMTLAFSDAWNDGAGCMMSCFFAVVILKM